MADVLNRITKQYIPSANTAKDADGNYLHYPIEDWVVKPDLSAVEGVPKKYWKIDGDTISEMTADEKQAVDDAEAAKRAAAIEQQALALADSPEFKAVQKMLTVGNSPSPTAAKARENFIKYYKEAMGG